MNRGRKIKSDYGISLDVYDLLCEIHPTCGICDKPFGDGSLARVIDHDHVTAEIRGLLHRKCNAALGLLGDDAAGLMAALEYVKGRGESAIFSKELDV
jgi:hypothetical protein